MQSAFVDVCEMDPLYKKAAVSIMDGHKAEFDWDKEDHRKGCSE